MGGREVRREGDAVNTYPSDESGGGGAQFRVVIVEGHVRERGGRISG